MSWETTVYKREELYEQVWAAPIRKVAKQYGVSDVALRKICRTLGIPLPEQGHWARKAAGHDVEQKPLPPAKEGQPTEHRAQRWRAIFHEVERRSKAQRIVERERDPSMAIAVSEELTDPHPLIRQSAGLLRKAAKDRDRIRELLREKPCLDIVALGDTLERALRIMDALLKALEQRGFKVEITSAMAAESWNSDYSRRRATPSITRVHITDSIIEFGIEEGFDTIKLEPELPKRSSKRLEPTWQFAPRPQYEHRPNGKLTLRIKSSHQYDTRQSWGDGKKQRVEHCLDAFIAGLIDAAEYQRNSRLEAEQRERERVAAERRRAEEARQHQIEAELAYDLDSRVADWLHARAIRQVAAAVEEVARQQSTAVTPESDLGRWLAWARRRAESLETNAIATVLKLRTPLPASPPRIPLSPPPAPYPWWLRGLS